MSPKFIEVTLFNTTNKVMINPRRLNSFYKNKSPTQQPELDCGTVLDFGGNQRMIVSESVTDIKRLLK